MKKLLFKITLQTTSTVLSRHQTENLPDEKPKNNFNFSRRGSRKTQRIHSRSIGLRDMRNRPSVTSNYINKDSLFDVKIKQT